MLIGFTQGMNHTTRTPLAAGAFKRIFTLRRCWQEGIEENQRGRRVPIIFSLFVEKGSKTQGHLQAPGMEKQLLAWLSRVLSQESKDTKGRRVEVHPRQVFGAESGIDAMSQ
jgi:hypothetical protein